MNRPLLVAGSLLGVFALTPACEPELSSLGGTAAPQQPAGVTAPRLRLRISGSLEGYLMPCGCASGQLGGLARRAFRNKLDARGIDLKIEGGNLIKKAGELELSKLATTLEILDAEGYHALGLGAKDLDLGKDDLGGLLQSFPTLPAVAADLQLAGGGAWQDEDGKPVVRPYREEKLAHVTVRTTALTMALPDGAAAKAFGLLTPQQGWARAMQGVAADTYRVLMVHADRETIKKLDLDPKPDLIVAISNDYVEPPARADQTPAGVPLVYPGVHGRVLLDVTLVRAAQGPMLTRYQLVPLKGSPSAPNAMRDKVAAAIILGHRQTVKELGMREELAGRKTLPDGLRYVGAKRCAECHDVIDETCQPHKHRKAWQTLIDAEKREKWPVTHYPECVSCHVVGYGYKSGFVSPEKTPDLLNVTCENCHGPGSKHADDDSVRMPHDASKVSTCTVCHNFEHSPKFHYGEYWKQIEHGK